MKKIWLIRKDEEGVSPVIATILMVAITVVLAAVLYVMVAGLIGGGGKAAPTVTLNPAESTGLNKYKVAIAGITPPETISNFKVLLQEGTTTVIAATILTTGNVGGGTGGVPYLNFTDLDAGGKLTGGDYFTLEQTTSGKIYTLYLLWGATGDQITNREIRT